MEIAGLAIGVAGLAGLFSACEDAINHVDSYRKFGVESRYLSAQLEADRVIFQKWRDGVGISKGGSLEFHDKRLDDPSTFAAVSRILMSIQEVWGFANPRASKLQPKPGDDPPILQIKGRALILRHYEPGNHLPLKSGDKLRWSMGGKNKFSTQVEMMEHPLAFHSDA